MDLSQKWKGEGEGKEKKGNVANNLKSVERGPMSRCTYLRAFSFIHKYNMFSPLSNIFILNPKTREEFSLEYWNPSPDLSGGGDLRIESPRK